MYVLRERYLKVNPNESICSMLTPAEHPPSMLKTGNEPYENIEQPLLRSARQTISFEILHSAEGRQQKIGICSALCSTISIGLRSVRPINPSVKQADFYINLRRNLVLKSAENASCLCFFWCLIGQMANFGSVLLAYTTPVLKQSIIGPM